MFLPPIPCHITFFNFFFNRSALRFSLYLHWLILLCKCISPGLLLEIPLDFFSISVAIVIVGLYIFIFFYHLFLRGMFGSVFKKLISSSWFGQRYSSQSKLVCVDVARGLDMMAEFSVACMNF